MSSSKLKKMVEKLLTKKIQADLLRRGFSNPVETMKILRKAGIPKSIGEAKALAPGLVGPATYTAAALAPLAALSMQKKSSVAEAFTEELTAIRGNHETD